MKIACLLLLLCVVAVPKTEACCRCGQKPKPPKQEYNPGQTGGGLLGGNRERIPTTKAPNRRRYSTTRKPTQETRTYYHYTNREGFYGIRSQRKIRASRKDLGGHCVFGDGVYLTTLPPSMGKPALAKAMFNNPNYTAKVRYVFEIQLPKNLVLECDANRKVYLFKGDLYLSRFTSKSYEVDQRQRG